MDFSGNTILITGASSGIGYELARQLAEHSCSLILTARRIDVLEELKEKIKFRCNVEVYQSDVSDKAQTQTVYKNIIEKSGKIDIAILNAGVNQKTRAINFNSKDAEITFGANVFGLVNWIELLLPDFIKERRGMIVGVSSLADARGFSGSALYCASKAAATTMLESLRIDLKKYNVKVITVKPGFVKTPMTDKNKFYMPQLMNVEKAASIIIDGLKKGKSRIEFPRMLALSSKTVKRLPDSVFEFIHSFYTLDKKS